MYSPTLGRFLQVDPSGYPRSTNLYVYVSNDPLNAWDPSGLNTQYSVGVGGTLALILGIGAGANAGVSVPHRLLDISGYQLFTNLQIQGMAGGGLFGGYGLQFGRSTTPGPLSTFDASGGLYVEGDIGYGVAAGGSATLQPNSGGGLSLSGISISPVSRFGVGAGFYVGGGLTGNVGVATPTFGQIFSWAESMMEGTSSHGPQAPAAEPVDLTSSFPAGTISTDVPSTINLSGQASSPSSAVK